MRVAGLLIIAAAGLAACGGADSPTAATERPAPQAPRRAIEDWSRFGTIGFYFLPLPNNWTQEPFDAALSPTVTVCRMTAGVCGGTLATFTRTSGSYGRLVTVNSAGRSYNVSWPVTTGNGYAAGRTYRVKVRVSGRELGFMDVQVVANAAQAAAVDTSQFRAAVIGGNFPISFRINQGIPASITLSQSSFNLNVNDGRAVTATMVDLRGQVMNLPLKWEIETTSAAPGAVAVLDSGMVVGAHPGTATLWVWYRNLEVQVPITVSDTRRAWTAMATPDQGGNRSLWGSSATNVYAANNTGILRYDGTAWSHVEAVRWRGMYDVYGTSASNVWAVGENGMILRFNGTAWTAWRFDGTTVAPYDLNTWELPGENVSLRSVFPIPGTSLIGIVGDGGTALVYDGSSFSTWSVYNTGDGADITHVWGTSYFNLYVTTDDGRLQRFDGNDLSTVSGVTAPGGMKSVWGTASNNVYAVGGGGMLWRYNGSSWSRIRLPTRGTLYAVYGTSASNVFVAGSDGALYRFNGTTWTPEKHGVANTQVHAFWTASNGDTFLAGAGGLIAKR
ncbi:MAG TPA: hypothetical protein VEX86_05935 [Longimicrobium sp.]|nr:hypothetical protein [Longimicrobium sp.]